MSDYYLDIKDIGIVDLNKLSKEEIDIIKEEFADGVKLIPQQLTNGKWGWVAVAVYGNNYNDEGEVMSEISINTSFEEDKNDLIETY